MPLPDGVTVTPLGKDANDRMHYEWVKGSQAIHLDMRDVEGGYEQAFCNLCNDFDCEHALAVLEFEVPEDSEWSLTDPKSVKDAPSDPMSDGDHGNYAIKHLDDDTTLLAF